jgi:hypothetical protein
MQIVYLQGEIQQRRQPASEYQSAIHNTQQQRITICKLLSDLLRHSSYRRLDGLRIIEAYCGSTNAINVCGGGSQRT